MAYILPQGGAQDIQSAAVSFSDALQRQQGFDLDTHRLKLEQEKADAAIADTRAVTQSRHLAMELSKAEENRKQQEFVFNRERDLQDVTDSKALQRADLGDLQRHIGEAFPQGMPGQVERHARERWKAISGIEDAVMRGKAMSDFMADIDRWSVEHSQSLPEGESAAITSVLERQLRERGVPNLGGTGAEGQAAWSEILERSARVPPELRGDFLINEIDGFVTAWDKRKAAAVAQKIGDAVGSGQFLNITPSGGPANEMSPEVQDALQQISRGLESGELRGDQAEALLREVFDGVKRQRRNVREQLRAAKLFDEWAGTDRSTQDFSEAQAILGEFESGDISLRDFQVKLSRVGTGPRQIEFFGRSHDDTHNLSSGIDWHSESLDSPATKWAMQAARAQAEHHLKTFTEFGDGEFESGPGEEGLTDFQLYELRLNEATKRFFKEIKAQTNRPSYLPDLPYQGGWRGDGGGGDIQDWMRQGEDYGPPRRREGYTPSPEEKARQEQVPGTRVHPPPADEEPPAGDEDPAGDEARPPALQNATTEAKRAADSLGVGKEFAKFSAAIDAIDPSLDRDATLEEVHRLAVEHNMPVGFYGTDEYGRFQAEILADRASKQKVVGDKREAERWKAWRGASGRRGRDW